MKKCTMLGLFLLVYIIYYTFTLQKSNPSTPSPTKRGTFVIEINGDI